MWRHVPCLMSLLLWLFHPVLSTFLFILYCLNFFLKCNSVVFFSVYIHEGYVTLIWKKDMVSTEVHFTWTESLNCLLAGALRATQVTGQTSSANVQKKKGRKKEKEKRHTYIVPVVEFVTFLPQAWLQLPKKSILLLLTDKGRLHLHLWAESLDEFPPRPDDQRRIANRYRAAARSWAQTPPLSDGHN